MEKLAAGQSALPLILALLAGGGVGSQLPGSGDAVQNIVGAAGGGATGATLGAILSMLASKGRNPLPMMGRAGAAGGGIGATAGPSIMNDLAQKFPMGGESL